MHRVCPHASRVYTPVHSCTLRTGRPREGMPDPLVRCIERDQARMPRGQGLTRPHPSSCCQSRPRVRLRRARYQDSTELFCSRAQDTLSPPQGGLKRDVSRQLGHVSNIRRLPRPAYSPVGSTDGTPQSPCATSGVGSSSSSSSSKQGRGRGKVCELTVFGSGVQCRVGVSRTRGEMVPGLESDSASSPQEMR